MSHWYAIVSVLAVMAQAAALLLAGAASADVDGKAVYDKSCAACHGPDGRGDTPTGKVLKVVDLVGTRWAAVEAVPEIAKAVREGVPRMPPMASKLKPEEIEAVARYTQQLIASGNPKP